MTNEEKAKKIFEELNIDKSSKIALEKFLTILNMAAEGKIDKETLKLLIKALPQFVALLKQSVDGIKQAAKNAQKSQEEVIKAVIAKLNTHNRTIELLAQEAESDETRLKLAEISIEIGKIGKETVNDLKEINRDNNSFWLKVTGILGSMLTFIVAIFISKNQVNSKS